VTAEKAAGPVAESANEPHEIDQLPGQINCDAKLPSPKNQAFALGFDVGSTGAIALLTALGEILWVVDMPCLPDGPAGRRAINAPLLSEIIAKSHAIASHSAGPLAKALALASEEAP
jgi:hypothetical protein